MLGFGPGERWFGVVEWDEPDIWGGLDNDCVHGELTLISKRRLPTRKVMVVHSSRQMTLVDYPSAGTIQYSVRVLDLCGASRWKLHSLHYCGSRQLCGLPSKPWPGNMTQRW